MAFKDEERDSGVMNFGQVLSWVASNAVTDAQRKEADEAFEELVEGTIKKTREERIEGGKFAIENMTAQFLLCLLSNRLTGGAQAIAHFVFLATRLGCAGLDPVSPSKKAEITEYFTSTGMEADAMANAKSMYDYKELDDEGYRCLVDDYLCAIPDPYSEEGLTYTMSLFYYMLLVACADEVNENGIKAIRKLREDYLEYAPLKENGTLTEFMGTFNADLYKS